MLTTVYIATSLDGYIARKNGDIDWLLNIENPDNSDYGYADFMKTIDAVVIGRGTFETVLGYPSWPYAKPIFVLSSTMTRVADKVRDGVTLINMVPKDVIDFLGKHGFTSIYVDGGKTIQGFLKEDLIDRMIITRVPILLGSGIPLFGFLKLDIHYGHMETKVFANGLVRSSYERIRGNPMNSTTVS